jgi:hypothetical protein
MGGFSVAVGTEFDGLSEDKNDAKLFGGERSSSDEGAAGGDSQENTVISRVRQKARRLEQGGKKTTNYHTCPAVLYWHKLNNIIEYKIGELGQPWRSREPLFSTVTRNSDRLISCGYVT